MKEKAELELLRRGSGSCTGARRMACSTTGGHRAVSWNSLEDGKELHGVPDSGQQHDRSEGGAGWATKTDCA